MLSVCSISQMIIIITVIIVAFMVDIGKMVKELVLEGRRAPKKH